MSYKMVSIVLPAFLCYLCASVFQSSFSNLLVWLRPSAALRFKIFLLLPFATIYDAGFLSKTT